MTHSVLHVIPSLAIGGAEVLLLGLLRGARDHGYRQLVVTMADSGALVDTCRNDGIPVHTLGMRPNRPNVRSLVAFRRLLRRERPAVVQGWMYHGNLLALIGAAGLAWRPRVVWTLHSGAAGPHALRPFTRLLLRLGAVLSARPAALVANSESTRDYHIARGYRPRQWHVIHNGVDINRFAPDAAARADVQGELGVPPDAMLVGLFARWDPIKDHRSFLRAAAQVASENPTVHVVLAGPGITPSNESLARLLGELPALAGRVHLLGERTDMPRLNAALAVAAVTSLSESFSLTAAEAMACGVPCVVTDIEFLPTLVGDSGIVVPVRDVAAITTALRTLIALPEEERRARGARARHRIVQSFSLATMVARYLELYEAVLAPAASRGHGHPPMFTANRGDRR